MRESILINDLIIFFLFSFFDLDRRESILISLSCVCMCVCAADLIFSFWLLVELSVIFQ